MGLPLLPLNSHYFEFFFFSDSAQSNRQRSLLSPLRDKMISSEWLPCCPAVVALTVCLWGWPCCSGGSGLLFPSALSLPLTASHPRSAEALVPSPCLCQGSTSPGKNTYDMERPRSDRMQYMLHIMLHFYDKIVSLSGN